MCTTDGAQYRFSSHVAIHPTDEVMEDSVERKQTRAHTRSEWFTDRNYADDLALINDLALEPWRPVLADSEPNNEYIFGIEFVLCRLKD